MGYGALSPGFVWGSSGSGLEGFRGVSGSLGAGLEFGLGWRWLSFWEVLQFGLSDPLLLSVNDCYSDRKSVTQSSIDKSSSSVTNRW